MKDIRGWAFKYAYDLRRKLNLFFLNFPVHFVCFLKGIQVGKKVKFYGFPTIHRYPNSRISIGEGCVFNNSKHSVESKLIKPNAFVTLQKDAQIIFGNNSGATGSSFTARKSIVIGQNVMIGSNCIILDNDLHNTNPWQRGLNIKEQVSASPVVIEDNVFMGFNCLVLKGVTIGKNSVIGANSVVIKSIPPDSIAIGNPCKLILKRNWGKSANS